MAWKGGAPYSFVPGSPCRFIGRLKKKYSPLPDSIFPVWMSTCFVILLKIENTLMQML